ncbi:MAG: hypothetical protein AAGB15_02060 [Pseudomonadota bacterium]
MKHAIVAVVFAAILSGCSSYMAASGERKRDMDILSPGTSRDVILAEFGAPTATINDQDAIPVERYDIFKFVQGRSTASNAGRAVFYGAAAVLTLGLSEVIATPLEGAVGDVGEVRLRADYDTDWRLTMARLLDGNEWVSVTQYNANRRAEAEAAAKRAASE